MSYANCCEHRHHANHPCCTLHVRRRGDGLFATLFKLMILYVVLVFGAGTLINTGHPVAVEAGQLIHLLTFVDPLIQWTGSNGWDQLAGGLRMLANGAPIGALMHG